MKQLRTVPESSGSPVRIRTGDIPAHVAVNLAQTLFEVLHREFEDPEVRTQSETGGSLTDPLPVTNDLNVRRE